MLNVYQKYCHVYCEIITTIYWVFIRGITVIFS